MAATTTIRSVLGSYIVEEIFRSDDNNTCSWMVQEGQVLYCILSLNGVHIGKHSLDRSPDDMMSMSEYYDWLMDQKNIKRSVETKGMIGKITIQSTLNSQDIKEKKIYIQEIRWADVFIDMLFVTVCSIFMIGIGSAVVYNQPRNLWSWILFIFTFATAISLSVNSTHLLSGHIRDPIALHFVHILSIISGISGVLSLGLILLHFPITQFRSPIRELILILQVMIGISGPVGFMLGYLQAPYTSVKILVLIVFALMIHAGFRRYEYQSHRLQIRWILWGITPPFIVWIISYWFVRENRIAEGILMASTVTIPLGIGVAMLRYNLLNIQHLLRRTALGAALTIVALFLYNFVISLFVGTISSSQEDLFPVILLSAMLLTFVLGPIQARLDDNMERLLFRGKYHFKIILGQLPARLSRSRSLEEASTQTLMDMSEGLQLPDLRLALPPSCGGGMWERSLNGEIHRRSSTVPWGALQQVEGAVLCAPEDNAEIHRWMVEAGVELLIPLRSGKDIEGVFLCPPLPGQRVYDADDVEALESAAAGLALSINTLLSAEALRSLNEELEQRIEQRTTELERAQLAMYRQEKMASLGVLAAGLAHELNTPLSVVRSTAQLLHDREIPVGHRSSQLTRLCWEAAERAASIVRDLQSFSRPDAEDLVEFDLGEGIAATVRLLEHQFSLRGVTLTVEMETLPQIQGYPAMLNQVVMNLMLNALKAVSPEGGVVWVRLSHPHPEWVEIVVEDNGPGLPPEIRNRIFEPFFTTREPGEGTGLGLALCFTFVQAHGGEITEEGARGRGARFVVRLPVHRTTRDREGITGAQ